MRQKLKYVAVPLLVVGLGVLTWSLWPEPNNANFPEGTDWLCANKSDPHHFKLTMKALAEHTRNNYGQRPTCPTCGQESYRAEKCAHCGKVYPQGRGPQICPYCKKPQAVPQG